MTAKRSVPVPNTPRLTPRFDAATDVVLKQTFQQGVLKRAYWSCHVQLQLGETLPVLRPTGGRNYPGKRPQTVRS